MINFKTIFITKIEYMYAIQEGHAVEQSCQLSVIWKVFCPINKILLIVNLLTISHFLLFLNNS
jgi:hypothetical protein